jgi:CheY-like chemotaxis protein
MLGEDDGVAAAEGLLRALGPVPVIFLTGLARSAELARLHAAGARGVIAKPFDPRALVSQVEQMLADRSP